MSGHTPGPWKVESRVAKGTYYPMADRVAKEDFPWIINVPSPPFALGALGAMVSFENGEANARLIAAAPELLEACRAALPLLKAMYAVVPVSFGEGPVNALVEAAIAKAEGRS